ncbi:hypothetical protein ACOMHN_051392 [Nucella lapillus]
MFLQDQDINILATSLLQVPVSFIKPVGSLLLATPSMDPPSVPAAEARDESPDAGVQLCAESATEGMITSPATPVTTLPSDSYSVLSCQFTPTHIVLHPPTPFSRATEPSSTELKELMLNSSPVRTKCKKLRRRTLCFGQRQNKTPKCQLNLHKLQFKEMKDNIDELTISQDDMKVTFASLIEDAKTSTKNELKTLMKSKINLVSSDVDGLHGEVTQLRASVDILCKENQSLKCQLRNLRSELRDVKATHLVTNDGAHCDPNEHKQTAESSITSVSTASPAVAQFRQTVPAGPVVPTSGKVDSKDPQLRGGDRGDGSGLPPVQLWATLPPVQMWVTLLPVQLWVTLPPTHLWVVLPLVQLWVTLPPAHLWVTLLPVRLRMDLPPAQLWVALLPVQLWVALLPVQLWMALLPAQLWMSLLPVQLLVALSPVQLHVYP